MKRLWKRARLLFVLALLFQVVGYPFYTLADSEEGRPSWTSPVNYLALGDSLAAGVTPKNELGNGYTDFIAAELKGEGVLQSFNKGFTYPGYTTQNVLDDIKNDITKPIVGAGDTTKNASLKTSIKEADIITLSAGANDVLPAIKVDSSTGALSYDLFKIGAGLQQVGTNTQTILKEIYALNPDVKVYVMGYYNPFPFLSGEHQKQAEQLLANLNGTIQKAMAGSSATYISTQNQIAEKATDYLPNPQNIHLSESGYKVAASLFKEQIFKDQPWIAEDTLKATVQNSVAFLTWKPAVDDKKVTGYTLYNGTAKIAEVAGDITSYQVKNIGFNQSLTFFIKAIDEEGNVSIDAPSVTVSTSSSLMFKDIEKHGSREFIEQAAMVGIVGGYEDGTFKPNNHLTRAQAASIIVKALDLKVTQTAPFTDIQGYSNKTQEAIAAAYQFGIVKGDKGLFNPGKPVTRGQLALMLMRSYELATQKSYIPTQASPFTDISQYHQETKNAINMVYTFDIAVGKDGRFMPNDTATRAQAAKMFVKALQLLK